MGKQDDRIYNFMELLYVNLTPFSAIFSKLNIVTEMGHCAYAGMYVHARVGSFVRGVQHRPLSSSVSYGFVLWLMVWVSVMARAMVRARVRVSVSDGISFNSFGLRSWLWST